MTAALIDVKTAPDVRDVVHRAVQALAQGQLVVFPTETVYGVVASALDTAAMDRMATLVGQLSSVAPPAAGQAPPEGQGPAAGQGPGGPGHVARGIAPMTLAVRSAEEVADYVPSLNQLAYRLARRCWPGPVTLVLEDNHPDSLRHQLPERVQQAIAPEHWLGLSVPAHPLILDSLRLLPGPVVITGCSGPGQPDCLDAQAAMAQVGAAVDLILDDGPCQFGQPSSVLAVEGNCLRVLREGVVSAATLHRLASCMVLFVCTGNTCRSPMAQVMARKFLAEQLGCTMDELEDRGFTVGSAGIAAMAGGRATAEAIQVMEQRGLNLQAHVSQPLSDRLVRFADLMLTMTHGHRQAMLENWPEAAERTRLISADQSDIADPIGGSIDMYRRCANQLEAAMRPHLLALLEDRPVLELPSPRKESR